MVTVSQPARGISIAGAKRSGRPGRGGAPGGVQAGDFAVAPHDGKKIAAQTVAARLDHRERDRGRERGIDARCHHGAAWRSRLGSPAVARWRQHCGRVSASVEKHRPASSRSRNAVRAGLFRGGRSSTRLPRWRPAAWLVVSLPEPRRRQPRCAAQSQRGTPEVAHDSHRRPPSVACAAATARGKDSIRPFTARRAAAT